MRKLTVCFVLAAFASVSSVQAGEKSEKRQTTRAAATQEACSASTKASCGDKSACCATTVKARHAMRGATLLARR